MMSHLLPLSWTGVKYPSVRKKGRSSNWLREYKVVEIDDGTEPELEIIHPRIAKFTLSDIRFAIDQSRLTIMSSVHDHNIILGVFNRLFAELLPHTPLRAVGINFDDHIDLGSFEKRNEIGRRLAPIGPWGAWGENLDNADPMLNGGLTNLSLKKVRQKPPLESYSMATIAPSAMKELKETGIFLKAMRTAHGIGFRPNLRVCPPTDLEVI